MCIYVSLHQRPVGKKGDIHFTAMESIVARCTLATEAILVGMIWTHAAAHMTSVWTLPGATVTRMFSHFLKPSVSDIIFNKHRLVK